MQHASRRNFLGKLKALDKKSAPIGSWEVKLEIMRDRPTKGHKGSLGSLTSNKRF